MSCSIFCLFLASCCWNLIFAMQITFCIQAQLKNQNLLNLFSTILWNSWNSNVNMIVKFEITSGYTTSQRFFIFSNISKWNSSLKYTFDKNFRCLSIFYNRYECFSPAIILKITETSNFQKNHLKESSMACRKHMASLIENRKCNFYLIYIHVGEVNM
jgi:hypothetical protein